MEYEKYRIARPDKLPQLRQTGNEGKYFHRILVDVGLGIRGRGFTCGNYLLTLA